MQASIRIIIISAIISVALCGGAWLAFAGSPARLYVVNTLSEDVSVIDTAADTVVSTLKLGMQGFNIAFSPRRDRAYVTVMPGATSDEQVSPGVLVLDVKAGKVVDLIPAPLSPLATIHVRPDGKTACVVTAAEAGKRNEARGRVLFLDLANRKVRKSVEIGLNPLDSAMTPDGKRLYTADWGSRSISVVDLVQERLADTIPLGTDPARVLALRPDGKTLYAVQEAAPMVIYNAGMNAMNAQPYNNMAQTALPQTRASALWVIDTATGKSEKAPLDTFAQVHALAVAPDGGALYVYGRVPAVIRVSGEQGGGRQAAQQQQQAFNLHSTDGYSLVAIDLKTKQIARRLGDFGFLSGLHVSPDGGKLYLTGTPGNPQKEAATQSRSRAHIETAQRNQNVNSKAAATIMLDLSTLPKSVTVLDAKTGASLKSLTIGSLPQGGALLREEEGK